jgi:hypothetical protein
MQTRITHRHGIDIAYQRFGAAGARAGICPFEVPSTDVDRRRSCRALMSADSVPYAGSVPVRRRAREVE